MHELKTTSHAIKSHRIIINSNTNATTKQPTRSNRRGTQHQQQQQQQQRTGRPSITSVTADQHKGTQQRIAARAATAMAQFRKRQPRNFLSWGDNRKATIKRYPDGTQEILVPQTLTHEQEHYEFPPRSRLLKKLANSTAERQRLSLSQPNITQLPQHPTQSTLVTHSTVSIAVEPDQSALTEWFSGRRRQYRLQQQEQQEQQEQEHLQKQPSAKEKAVMDWMTDIEQSTSLLKSPNASHIEKGPTLNALDLKGIQDTGIHFKSNAGKLLASGSSCQKLFDDLSSPDEDTRIHYVRRWRLNNCGNRPRPTHSHPRQYQQLEPRVPFAYITPELILPPTTHHYHHQVPRPNMSSPPATKSGMVQLVQMFHKTLQEQQARAHERMQQLETLLEEERCKRQDIQRTQQLAMSRLDNFMVKYEGYRTPPSPTLSTASSPSLPSIPLSSSKQSQQNRYGEQSADWTQWMGRIKSLETSIETESRSRDYLQQSIDHAHKEMDVLKESVSAQAYEHTIARQQLEKKIDEAFTNLARLTRQRHL